MVQERCSDLCATETDLSEKQFDYLRILKRCTKKTNVSRLPKKQCELKPIMKCHLADKSTSGIQFYGSCTSIRLQYFSLPYLDSLLQGCYVDFRETAPNYVYMQA